MAGYWHDVFAFSTQKAEVISSYALRAWGLLARGRYSIRSRWAGADPNWSTRRHAVYVHYDANGRIADFILEALRQLMCIGYRVTFISNAPAIAEAQINQLRSLCREIILRRNVGYDFGAYRDGILSIPNLRSSECLIIMNDSVYGPLFPLEEIISKCDPAVCDVWGATDSEEIIYHLQSYFLVFFPRALRSWAFSRFWYLFPNISDRKQVIEFGEIGLSQQLIRGGLRNGAVFKCADAEVRKSRKIAAVKLLPRDKKTEAFLRLLAEPARRGPVLNPTQFFWEELVVHERYPFLKRDLLRDNLWNVPAVIPWQKLIRDFTSYDVTLIERHIASEKGAH